MFATELCLWALAAKYARKNFGRLVLNTDSAGARLLVDRLGIEADEVRLTLDHFDPGLPNTWAMGKLETYRQAALRGEVFCHLDGDAILWQPLPDYLLHAPLLTQYSEAEIPAYYPLARLAPHFPALPPEVSDCVKRRVYNGYNAGIIGGNDLEFFRVYTEAAFATARHPANRKAREVWGTFTSIFLEQYFFGCFAIARHTPVATLLGPPVDSALSHSAQQTAHVAGFTHFLGNSKRNPKYAPGIFARTERELPGVLERARALARN